MTMPVRRAGSTALEVSALGLGCLSMTEFYDAGDVTAGEKVIRRALDMGITLVDTADVYGAGTNEELVGRAIRGRRAEALVATKFGNVLDERGEFAQVRGNAEFVRRACE